MDETLTLMVVSEAMTPTRDDGVSPPQAALRRETAPSCPANVVPGRTRNLAWGGNEISPLPSK